MSLWMVGVALGAVATSLLLCLGFALLWSEPWESFARATLLTFAAAGLLVWPARGAHASLNHRSALVAVSASWIAACAAGALPFIGHASVNLGAIDAFFEAASGFTTTGATVISGLDRAPYSLLLWRALMHLLGGMGIVLLGIAVLPVLGLGGMQLFRAEAPGPTKDKLTPRIAETAKILWTLYMGLIAVHGVLLWASGMTAFDAVCHAIGSLSTGGFSTHDASLAHYDSPLILNQISFFMLLGGTNFVILHRMLTQGVAWRENTELRAFAAIVLLGTFLIALDLRLNRTEQFGTSGSALVHALFQVASIISTTGYTARDFDLWPELSHGVLLLLLMVGGMAGSTAGGPKVVRIVLAAKFAAAQCFRLIHPRGVLRIKLDNRAVDNDVILGVLGFMAAWGLIAAFGTFLLAAFGSDVNTALSAALATFGNVGPGFGEAGPARVYATFAPQAKVVMSVLMILGRLEIFTLLVLLAPGFWRD
jgi:trk system potassium uptake protein